MITKPFYQSEFFRSLAEGLIIPFMPLFALSLGATKTLIGLLTALPTFTSLFAQLFWASITELTEKKKFLVIIGGMIWAIFWIPIAYVSNPWHLVILVTIQAIFSSIQIPALTTLLIRLTPSYKRGQIASYVNTFAGLGSFVGTLVGGYVLNQFGFIYFLFYAIFLFGIISKILFVPVHEPPSYTQRSFEDSFKGTFNFFSLKREKKLLSLIKAIIFINFAVAIPGPFFSVYVIENLGGSRMDVGIISAISAIISLAFYRSWGTLIDYLGKKTIMLSCLIPISLLPFVYAISNHVYWIYVYTIVSSMSWAGFNLAVFTYLSDIVPKRMMPSYIAMYNLLTGTSAAIAPFIGGIIADFSSIWVVFILSTILRFSSIYFFDKLEERTGFKPKGIFKFEFEPFGLSYRLGDFVSTYSLAIAELRKESFRIINFKRLFRKR